MMASPARDPASRVSGGQAGVNPGSPAPPQGRSRTGVPVSTTRWRNNEQWRPQPEHTRASCTGASEIRGPALGGRPGLRGARRYWARRLRLQPGQHRPGHAELRPLPGQLGATQQAINNCDKQSGGKYTISYQAPPTGADGQRLQLVRRLAAHHSTIDIMGLDVTWEPEFAEAGWIQPWTGAGAGHQSGGRLLGHLVHVPAGWDARADVDELADARFGGQEPDGPPEKGPVGAGDARGCSARSRSSRGPRPDRRGSCCSRRASSRRRGRCSPCRCRFLVVPSWIPRPCRLPSCRRRPFLHGHRSGAFWGLARPRSRSAPNGCAPGAATPGGAWGGTRSGPLSSTTTRNPVGLVDRVVLRHRLVRCGQVCRPPDTRRNVPLARPDPRPEPRGGRARLPGQHAA